MKKILFVDDESNLLDGLKRMLRPMRNEWDMSFATSGDQALQILGDAAFDVLVSDMRMPGMDGTALLTEVMKRHPNVVRIVLSGQSSKTASMRAVGAAHQFLSKPCDANTLKRTIERAISLRAVLANDALAQVLTQVKTFPSMPTLCVEINEELHHPDASSKRVGEIIAQDAGMTAKILQLVNSSFFGIGRTVNNPVNAASLLGTETLQALVLSIGIFSEFDFAAIPGLDMQVLWEHGMKTGALARRIAASERVSKSVEDDAMLAGLMHDAGKLVLAQNLRDSFAEALEMAQQRQIPLCDAERDVIGATHAEVGAYLLGLWGLPDSLVEAVALHHCPARGATDGFTALTAVHVANVLEHEIHNEGTLSSTASPLDLDYLARIDLADRLPEWRECAQQLLNEGVTS